ncbi:hypothetical protein CVT26_015178 [Gymnopilus dilepis]|uniref:Uncharacterized protein n=1 Tax=Gymnopilus dilepis TaxID=231916 RepID=A0A409WS00_9AGAR|nr:hypothetical protein CVT26_015178 [Gymnopilus dilepis]
MAPRSTRASTNNSASSNIESSMTNMNLDNNLNGTPPLLPLLAVPAPSSSIDVPVSANVASGSGQAGQDIQMADAPSGPHFSAETPSPQQPPASIPPQSATNQPPAPVQGQPSAPVAPQPANQVQQAPANTANANAAQPAQAAPPQPPAGQQNVQGAQNAQPQPQPAPAPGAALFPAGTIQPHDYYNRPFPSWTPIEGFSRITRISPYLYGILDAGGAVHAIHAGQLARYLRFAYLCLGHAPPRPLYPPIGFREFVSLVNNDPVQVSRLTVLDDNGQLVAPPTTNRYPLEVNFPSDDQIRVAALALRSLGGNVNNVESINDIVISQARRASHPYAKNRRGRGGGPGQRSNFHGGQGNNASWPGPGFPDDGLPF